MTNMYVLILLLDDFNGEISIPFLDHSDFKLLVLIDIIFVLKLGFKLLDFHVGVI